MTAQFNRLLSKWDTPTHLYKHTWDYLFIHLIPVFSLSFILSTCLCSSPQRRRHLPSTRVWSLSTSLWRSCRRNALPKGEWLSTCNYPSLFFLFFIPRSLPSSPVVSHLSDITVMGRRTGRSFILPFFFRALWEIIRSTQADWGHAGYICVFPPTQIALCDNKQSRLCQP